MMKRLWIALLILALLAWTGSLPTAITSLVKAELETSPYPQLATQNSLPDKFLFAISAQAPVGQFNSPTGVAVASDGTVYVADQANHRIQHFSANGDFLGVWGKLGSADGQFWYPTSVAVASSGTVYVADQQNHRIQRFSPAGAFLGKWGSQGNGDGQFQYPTGVSVASDGTVYVADNGNHRIQRFTSTGTFLGRWGNQGNGDGQLNGPWGIAIASDGTVYVADRGNHRIQHFSATGTFLGKWGSEGSADGQFREPSGLAIGGGRVYVADKWNYRVQVFTTAGTFIAKWGFWYWLEGVAIDDISGRVYVADSGMNRIVVCTTDGSAITQWGSRGSGDGQFDVPSNVVASSSTLYVAEGGANHRLQRFSPIGAFVLKWGSFGSGDGQFNWPSGVGVAPDGTVYVTDGGNHRIQHFDPSGAFLGKWGSPGNGDGQFGLGPNGAGPRGLGVAPDGTVYVVDTWNHRIQHFSATGVFLGKWGTQGSGDGQFDEPVDVAVAPDGTVYVADGWRNQRIQHFTATGSFLGKWGTRGTGDGQFNDPWGVTVAPDGTIYVADRGNQRVQRFSNTGVFLGKFGIYGSGDGKFNNPMGLSVAPDGTLYVAEYWNSRIEAFGSEYSTMWRGEYFANRWLAEAPVLIRQDAAVDFNWGSGSPGTGVPADNFSARWQRYVSFDANTYRFTVFTDDGVRLWVDDKLLIEAWQDPQVTTYSADISLAQGYHRVRLEYYEASGGAAVRLSWGTNTITPTSTSVVTWTNTPTSTPTRTPTSTATPTRTSTGTATATPPPTRTPTRLARVYLPIIAKNYFPPTPIPTSTSTPTPRPIRNPSFEDGLNYWQTAGVVAPSSEWKTNGQYAARLGEPSYWCAGGGVVGRNGVTQTFDVPSTGSTTLTFDYKIVTEDSLLESGDYLQMEINDGIVGRIGWQKGPSRCSGQPNIITGTYSIDLLGLGYQRGNSIKLGVFIVIVDQYYNTYGYVDNVRWGTP